MQSLQKGDNYCRPSSPNGSMYLNDDEKRQTHIRNINDLGSRAEKCWAEYRDSEVMKLRCEVIHWQSRQKALEAEVKYASEVIARKTNVLTKLQKCYGEIKRNTHPVPVYGAREGVHASGLAPDNKAPSNSCCSANFKHRQHRPVGSRNLSKLAR